MRMRPLLVGLLVLPMLMAADAATPPPGWKEYTPKDRSFSVLLPEKSNRRSERQRTATVRGVRMKINLIYVEVRGGLTYEASTLVLPTRMVRGIRLSEKLEIIRDIFLKEVGGKVSDEKAIKEGAATGKEYTIQTDKGMARLRAFARLGRLYRASVIGSKAQVASKNADIFLESFKLSGKAPAAVEAPSAKGKDKAEAPGKADVSGNKWIADANKMKLPDTPIAGKLLGGDFQPDTVKYQPNVSVLSLEQGQGDASIKIFLFIKRGDKLEDKTYKINARGKPGERRPHIHAGRKGTAGGAYIGDYAMRLEFGKEKDGMIPGKIYLCLPDDNKSIIAGTFSVKRP